MDIIELWISIIELWISISALRVDMFALLWIAMCAFKAARYGYPWYNNWYPQFEYGYPLFNSTKDMHDQKDSCFKLFSIWPPSSSWHIVVQYKMI